MIKLNLPEYKFKLKKEKEAHYLFDEIRNKWMVFNPEEWVRQNLLKYLYTDLNYPKNLISIEKQIIIANRTLRFDALVYSTDFSPLVIIECKAPNIKITQETFDQILTYNYIINSPYLLVTNGLFHVFCKINSDKTISFLEKIPSYKELSH